MLCGKLCKTSKKLILMLRILSFEGCIGAGKTALANYFAKELKNSKILEEHEKNPFLNEFYRGSNVLLETELTFLMLHYSQLKELSQQSVTPIVISDYSVEKDFVYAKLNLNEEEFNIFNIVYNFVIEKVGYPQTVIYIDLSLDILKRRIHQRGRSYEINTDSNYFIDFNNKIKEYYQSSKNSKIHFLNVDDLEFDLDNEKLNQIKEIIIKETRN